MDLVGRRSPHPSLAGMPYELLLKILRTHEGRQGLGHDEVKALRLACRHFAYGPTTRILFHTVSLSRVRRDLDSFLAIASHPQLAAEVRVIVWHELVEDMHSIDIDVPPTDSPSPSRLELIDFANALTKTLDEIFWLPTASHQPQEVPTDLQGSIISDVFTTLLKAVDSMPRLHTLISRPMHPTRRLTSPSDNTAYPVTPQILTGGFTQFEGSAKPADLMNLGFFSFLLPIASAQPPDRPIRRLCYSDEGAFTGLNRLQEPHISAFRHLTHIDLCISALRSRQDHELYELGRLLRSASSLTSLHLCFENGRPYQDKSVEPLPNGLQNPRVSSCSLNQLGIILLGCLDQSSNGLTNHARHEPRDPKFKWDNLRELRLTNCLFPIATLASFMTRQASSLKGLHLSECYLTETDLLTLGRSIAGSRDLALEQFTILQSETGGVLALFTFYEDDMDIDIDLDESPEQLHWIDQARLLNFVNAASRAPDLGPGFKMVEGIISDSWLEEFISKLDTQNAVFANELSNLRLGGRCLFTAMSTYDSDSCYPQAVCDTRRHYDAVSRLYDTDEIDQMDMENGDIRCPFGNSYQSGTTYGPLEDTTARYSRPLPCDLIDTQSAHLFEVVAGDEDEYEYKAFDYSLGYDFSPQDFDDGLRWVLARDRKGDMYYWREVDDSSDEKGDRDDNPFLGASHSAKAYSSSTSDQPFTSQKYKTELWRFTHHTGETAIGREPLEYWDDWTGLNAGDFAVPLPLGYTFRSFQLLTMGKPDRVCPDEHIQARGGIKYDETEHFGFDPDTINDPRRTPTVNEMRELGLSNYVNWYDWAEREARIPEVLRREFRWG